MKQVSAKSTKNKKMLSRDDTDHVDLDDEYNASMAGGYDTVLDDDGQEDVDMFTRGKEEVSEYRKNLKDLPQRTTKSHSKSTKFGRDFQQVDSVSIHCNSIQF
jgi:hypothetical protein